MRTISTLLLAAVLIAASAAPPTQAQEFSAPIRVFVDGERLRFDQPPVIIGGRVLVPVRGVFEELGAVVDWDPVSRLVIATRGDVTVELVIGRRTARVNERRVTLDVPAMIIGARTLVPLRFISEALGARVQWIESTRTVLIFSGAPVAQPPVFPPPPPGSQATVVTGMLVQVRTGDNPVIVVEHGTQLTRAEVTPDTAITRVNLSTNTGGSVSLRALRIGDDIEMRVAATGEALRVRATFRTVIGRLDAVAGGGRTLILTSGQAFRVADDGVEVIVDGRQAPLSALRAGMVVTLRLNPTSSLVFGITAETVTAGASVTRPDQPTILEPDAGALVTSPMRVRGRAEGAVRVIITVDTLLGVRLVSVEDRVGAQGFFSAQLSYGSLPRGFPIVITVVAVNSIGLQSDPVTVVVQQR